MMSNVRSASVLVACAAGFLGALAVGVLPSRAVAQDSPPPTSQNGRYQISTIPGAVYLVDTQTAAVWVRDYQNKTWRPAGNPLEK